ncbi:MAG: glutathione-independent formaldehyde dehydrogenase [Acidobacteriaceae bacterium]|nr:glutathione-independent formaldehyde dehydrogenase [Acidobacteriaceae bacterium]
MKGIILVEPHKVEVRQIPDAEIQESTDVLMRVTSTAICGTDLHFYEGRMPYNGKLIGHEPLGVVEEAGSAVKYVKKGDRIVVPTHICCGFCSNCVRGYSAACLTTHPGAAGAAYGYPNQGDYAGAQAELVRIPFADANCLKLPGEPGDQWEHDFVLLADIFPTGWHANELARVEAGDSVAIFGAGAVGLMAAYSARLRGASDVYVVDAVTERLGKAAELGAVPINFREEDPVQQIMGRRKKKRMDTAFRDEHVMDGVMCGIDAIGFQARSREDYSKEDPNWVIAALAELVNPTGRIAVVGIFPPQDPEGPDPAEQKGELTVPWGKLFKKGISIGLGRDQDERYNLMLRNMVVNGTARPGQIVSHRIPIEQAPEAFAQFDGRANGYIKVVLDPRQ